MLYMLALSSTERERKSEQYSTRIGGRQDRRVEWRELGRKGESDRGREGDHEFIKECER